MSLINDALRRAESEKNRNTPSDPPAMQASPPSPPPRGNGKTRLIVIVVIGAVVAAGGWFMLNGGGKTPSSARGSTYMPAARPGGTASATKKPAATSRPKTPIAAPAWSQDTSKAQPNKDPLTQSVKTPSTAPANGKSFDAAKNLLTSLANAFGRLSQPVKKDSHASGQPASTAPAQAGAAKTPAPVAAPAVKSDRSVEGTAGVAQQFRVTCIMFSGQDSTAIVNGSPVKVGQTIRADGVSKTGVIEEATVKKIDRGCVEIEFNGERYLLRI